MEEIVRKQGRHQEKLSGVLIAVLHTRPPFKYKNTSDLDPDASDDNNNKNKRNKK